MTLLQGFTYVFAGICVLSSIYVALGRDFLRMIIAFFIELLAVSGLLLTLGSDYLALIVFAVALMSVALAVSFSSGIVGDLKRVRQVPMPSSRSARISGLLGLVLGLCVGAAVGWAFLSNPHLESLSNANVQTTSPDVVKLGGMMLGGHMAVFELMSVLVLMVTVGAALLLRRPRDGR